MEKNANAPWSLILSTRLYQALLVVYPSEFRQAYGGPMLQVFRDSCQRVLRETGANGLLSLWARTMLDTLQTAIEEQLQRGVDMSKEKFFKFSGWALMLGGIAATLGWLASTRPAYDRFNYYSLPVDQVANAVVFPLIILGLLLLSMGFFGLLLRYGQESGSFGRFSLGLGALSGVISAVGVTGLGIFGNEPWWWIFFFSTIVQFLGLTLFGIVNLQRRALQRWIGLPILAGVWLPLSVLVSIIFELPRSEGGWEWAGLVFPVLWLLSLLGLAGLGYLLQSDAQPAGTTAAAG